MDQHVIHPPAKEAVSVTDKRAYRAAVLRGQARRVSIVAAVLP
ncbi:MAG: hypothetical protein AAGF30_15370 [Pseudomonadota bacterium]